MQIEFTFSVTLIFPADVMFILQFVFKRVTTIDSKKY